MMSAEISTRTDHLRARTEDVTRVTARSRLEAGPGKTLRMMGESCPQVLRAQSSRVGRVNRLQMGNTTEEKLLLLAILNRSRCSHLSLEFNGSALHLSLKWISFIQALSNAEYTLATLLSSIVWIRVRGTEENSPIRYEIYIAFIGCVTMNQE